MGYYVRILSTNFKVRKENFDDAYKALCELNTTHHHEKRGGSYSNGQKTRSWFSWMDADYPSKCKDLIEVLQMLGFGTRLDADGNLSDIQYDNKTGQEDLFFEALAPFVEPKSQVVWMGEDDCFFIWGFVPNSVTGKTKMVVGEVNAANLAIDTLQGMVTK